MITYQVFINNTLKGHVQAEDRQQAVVLACEMFDTNNVHLSKVSEWKVR